MITLSETPVKVSRGTTQTVLEANGAWHFALKATGTDFIPVKKGQILAVDYDIWVKKIAVYKTVTLKISKD